MVRNSDAVCGGFAVVVGDIYQHGVEHCLPWLVAMTMVVLVDLFTGMRKAWMLGEDLRWSKGFRQTISKLITYWAFVIGAVMVQEACRDVYPIAMWCCLLVSAIEGISIVGNILRPHGIEIDAKAVLKIFGKKVNVEGLEKVVKKTKKK